MYNIKPLEEEWERYNAKKKRPIYIISILSVILVLSVLFFLKYKDKIFTGMESNITINSGKKGVVLLDKPITELSVKNENIDDTAEPTLNIESNNNPMNASDVLIEVTEKPKIAIATENFEKPRKKVHLNIIQTTASSAYREVEKRFKDSHELDDALFLASSYYSDHNYKKAVYWSLEVNKLNGNIEESWLIFANSKAKTGHKNEAIRILTSYVEKSNSEEAKALLKKLKK